MPGQKEKYMKRVNSLQWEMVWRWVCAEYLRAGDWIKNKLFKVSINGPSVSWNWYVVWACKSVSHHLPPRSFSLVSNQSMLLSRCVHDHKLWFIEANRKHDRSNESLCWNFIRLEHFFLHFVHDFTFYCQSHLIFRKHTTISSCSMSRFLFLECCY